MVGKQYERGGIAKDGAKMVHAVANSVVPKFTVIIGGSFGAGNYGMCGRAYDPRFIFGWPNSKTAVMGGEQAAKVLSIVTEEKFKREGKEVDRAALDMMEQKVIDQFNRESTALYSTAHLWDDGLIDPRDTRKVLALCLSVAREADVRPLRGSTFGVARM
jgi:geranyl-CoA carboxylase beta subunit